MLTPRGSYLRTLGLESGAGKGALKSAYRKMAKRYHPDRFASGAHSDTERETARRRMLAVNAAYDWLSENGT